MQDILDRPPVDNEPPELPPFLRKRGGGGGKWILMPSILHAEACHPLLDHRNNWKTYVQHYMCRWNIETGQMLLAHSHSRRYRQWLELHDGDYEVPPHILFGGCIEPGEPDPTFYNRWIAWAKKYFA